MKIKNFAVIACFLICSGTQYLQASWFFTPKANHPTTMTISTPQPESLQEFKYLNYLEDDDDYDYEKIFKNTKIGRYFNETDEVVYTTEKFWEQNQNNIIALFNQEETNISDENYTILEEACRLGKQLEAYKLLEVFESQYNLLAACIDKLTFTENQSASLKKQAASLIESLYNNLPKNYRHQTAIQNFNQEQADVIATNRYRALEELQSSTKRIHNPTKVINGWYNPNKNIAHYAAISDVRGEGNCGYRAFLGSTLINSVIFQDFRAVQRLQKLIVDQFTNLFTKYATDNAHSYKLSVPNTFIHATQLDFTPEEIEAIRTSMLQKLNEITTYTSPDQVRKLFNEHQSFDFFMIMFLRTLLAEELLKPETYDLKVFALYNRMENENDSIDTYEPKYFTELLQWTTWIDDPELTVLANITGITINVIQKDAASNAHKKYIPKDQEPCGQADILFVHGNHYQILYPQTH